jgi:hypothetical protein
MAMEPPIESTDRSAPFSVRLSDTGGAISEFREPSGRPHRFSICKLDDPELFVIQRPSVFGGTEYVLVTEAQAKGLLCAELLEHEVDQLVDFAKRNPLRASD